jgi:hypothetical protein
MQTLYVPPSFPPVDFIASLPWRKIGQALLTAVLVITAVCHALALRLWAQRGRIRPLLVAMAQALLSAAESLPDSGQTIESQARSLALSGLSQRAIASRLNISRYKVAAILSA